MKEPAEKTELITESVREKTVTVFLQSGLLTIVGDWFWDMQAEAVFCSDVMMAFPADFEGTKSIFHPDDLLFVKEQLNKAGEHLRHLTFRIITTYGEVKLLEGKGLTILKAGESTLEIQEAAREKTIAEQEWKKEYDRLLLANQAFEKAERYTAIGVWWHNKTTGETWYSAQMFRMHDLPPFSLNAHLHTFTPFIHQEDKEVAIEYLEKAYEQNLALHLQYRIKTTASEKQVLHILQSFFSPKGELILSGTLRDVTELKTLDQKIEDTENQNVFYKQQLSFDAQQAALGHWQVNLLTRKKYYSDNFYRIFGLRSQATAASFHSFINYVHPDDREEVIEANKKMLHEHKIPELEYRIIRSDGKTRYISQKGKLVNYGNEMVMAGTIQDITVQRMLEKKLKHLADKEALQTVLQTQFEETAGSYSWMWNLNSGVIAGSDSLYRLLGLKPGVVQLSQKQIQFYVHPEDQEKFANQVTVFLQEKLETKFDFRFLIKGSVHYIRALFRTVTNAGEELFVATLQDATEIYQLNQNLAYQLQLSEALTENMRDRVIITNLDHTIIFWTKQCSEVYNIKKEDALGKNFFDVFPQLKTEEELQLFNKVLEGESVVLEGQKSVLGNGFYDLYMRPFWSDNQVAVEGIIHIIHSITKEVELHQSLAERLGFISSLVEASVDRIIALDKNMNYQYWNKKAEDYYEIKKEEVLGKNILEVFPGFINDPSYSQFRQALRGELVHITAKENLENQKGYFETYLIPVKNDKKEITGLLWIVHDLHKEYELQRQKQKELEVLNALNENYMAIDAEYRLLNINDKALEFFGKTKEELLGKSVFESFPQIANTPVDLALKKAIEEGVATRSEFISPVRGTWLNVSVAPTVDGVVVLFFEIQNLMEARHETTRMQQLMQAVIDSSLINIVVLKSIRNTEGTIVDFEFVLSNEKAERSLGKSLKGQRYLEVFNNKKQLFPQLAHIVETNASLETEVTYTIKGKEHWFHILAVKLEDGISVSAVEITNRKEAETHLKESRHLLQQTAKASPDAIVIYDIATMQPLFINNCLAEWIGCAEKDLMELEYEGRLQLIHPDDREKLIAFNRELANSNDGEVKTVEYRLSTKKGTTLWVRNRAKVFERDKQNNVTHILSVLQDCSEEVELRKRLTERSSYAEKLIDSSFDRMLVFDKEYKITGWNKRCEEIYHVRKEEAIGKSFFDFFPKVQQDEVVMNAMRQAFEGNFVTLPMKRETYTNAYSEIFFTPLKNEEGEVKELLNVLHDVSKFYLAKEELKEANVTLEHKNRELENKNEEITSFAFIASHDLREPLRKIHTFSDWLSNKESSLSDQGKDYLDRLAQSVKRLNSLIDDIMTLTQIHAVRDVVEEVDLNLVLSEVKGELYEWIREKEAVIEAENLNILRGNKRQLVFLFRNLINNALKFQKQENKPVLKIKSETIESPALSESDVKEGEFLRLSFSDNGIGIDLKYSAKIFKMFQRLNAAKDFEGTGMGLAICKKIMENHNGFMTVESELDKGSTFYCYFPLGKD